MKDLKMQPIAQIKTERTQSNIPGKNSFFEPRLTGSHQNIHKIIKQFKDQDENNLKISKTGEIKLHNKSRPDSARSKIPKKPTSKVRDPLTNSVRDPISNSS